MKHVIVLFLIFNLGCNERAVPNASSSPASEEKVEPNFLDLPKPKKLGEPTLFIQLEGDSFFYKNKKIERDEIKTLFMETKKKNKKKVKPVIELRTTKNTKMENVVFIMELGQKEGIDLVLQSEK